MKNCRNILIALAALSTLLFELSQACGSQGKNVNSGLTITGGTDGFTISGTNGRQVFVTTVNGEKHCKIIEKGETNEVKIKWGSDGVPKLVKGPDNTDVQAKYQVCLKTLENIEKNNAEREKRLKEEAEAREKRLKEQAEAREKRLKEQAEAREKRLKEEAEAREEKLAEQAEAREKRLKEEAEAREKRLAEQAEALQKRLKEQAEAREKRLAEQMRRLRESLANRA